MTTSPGWQPPVPFRTSSPGWAERGRDPIDVTLGGIRLRTTHSVRPSGGWEYGLSNIVGWWEPAPDRTSMVEHPSGSGMIAGARRTEDRQITITGLVEAAQDFGPGSLTAALDTLGGLRREVLVVDETQRGLTREADVRLVRMSVDRHAPWLAHVTLALVADDPLRFGSGYRELTNGAQTLTNRGDQTAWPVIELVGPHSAITITHPGGVWTLPALGAGVERTIDCRHGRVYDAAGTRVFGAGAGSGPWPRVPAGGGSWSVSGLGSGGVKVRRSEAWS